MSFNVGDTPPSNAWYNHALREAKRSMLVSATGGLELSRGGLSQVLTPRIWALISGSFAGVVIPGGDAEFLGRIHSPD